MAERRHRDRVDQLRIEAGVPLSPESIEVRHARLKDMQMVSGIPPRTGRSIFKILISHEGELGNQEAGFHLHSGLSSGSCSGCEHEIN